MSGPLPPSPGEHSPGLTSPGAALSGAMLSSNSLSRDNNVASSSLATLLPTAAALGSQSLQNLGDPYIRLELSDRLIAAVDTQQAREVLVIEPQQLTVIPNMAPSVMGLINHRSRIFWVVDLPHIFGFPPLDPRAAAYHLAILQVDNIHVGIAVQAIQGVTRIAQEAIASPLDSEVSPALVPYLRGCVSITQEAVQETLFVLDTAAIANYVPPTQASQASSHSSRPLLNR